MKILAIETSTEACSVALLHEGALLERSEIAPRRHAELVLPMAESLLAEAGLKRAQLDGIAVGRGPGAFTGVRLAISVAQGLAFALDLPVVTISSLAALAMQAPRDAEATLAIMDARMGEVYACAFKKGTEAINTRLNCLRPLFEECVVRAEDLVLPQGENWNVIGSGWNAYRDAILEHLPAPPRWAEGDRHPQARDVAMLALPHFEANDVSPPELALPVYLRDKVAFTTAEREAGSR